MDDEDLARVDAEIRRLEHAIKGLWRTMWCAIGTMAALWAALAIHILR